MKKAIAIILSVLVMSCVCACSPTPQSSSSGTAQSSSKASSGLSEKEQLANTAKTEWWKSFEAETKSLGSNYETKAFAFDAEWFAAEADAFSKIADSVQDYDGQYDRINYIHVSTKEAANAMALGTLEMEQACIEHNTGNDAKATEHAKRATGYFNAANSTIDSMTKVMNEINAK